MKNGRMLLTLNLIKNLQTFLANFLLLSTINASTLNVESHSLHYYFTTTSSTGPGQPSYHVGGYVDDVQVVRYTSDTRKVEPVSSCLEESMDPQHWVNQTTIAKHYEFRHQKIINDIKRLKLFNQTKGHRDTHVFQVQFWCELSGGNTISGYEEFAANGEGFIVLDTYILKFVPLISAAETITQDWNERRSRAERQKSYMEHECIVWLKNYLDCVWVKKRLMTVPPQVNVSGHQSHLFTKLQCWVYGFYPQAVEVKWKRNETDKVYSDEDNQILPNPDGTYQTRVIVKVPTGEEDSYSCHVDHSSLEKTIIEKWDKLIKESKTSRNHFCAIGAFVFIILFIICLVVVMYIIEQKFCVCSRAAVEPGPSASDSSTSGLQTARRRPS